MIIPLEEATALNSAFYEPLSLSLFDRRRRCRHCACAQNRRVPTFPSLVGGGRRRRWRLHARWRRQRGEELAENGGESVIRVSYSEML